MKKLFNTFSLKKYNKRQKYFFLFNILFIFIIVILNFNPELIFFKISLHETNEEIRNNFYSSIFLISIPYAVLYFGLDFDYKESILAKIAIFLYFYSFIALKETLEDYFKINMLIIALIIIFLSIIIVYLLLLFNKTGSFYEKSTKIEVKDFQFQIFILKIEWVKHYVFTYKKINSIANHDEIPSENKTYFFVLSEDEYKDLKNESGFFKNEIISIKSFQHINNYFYEFHNHIFSDINDSIEHMIKFNDEIRNFNSDLHNLKMKFGMYDNIVLRCISFKSEITNDRKIIRFKINDRCKDCLNDKKCINDDFFEVEYNEFKKFLL